MEESQPVLGDFFSLLLRESKLQIYCRRFAKCVDVPMFYHFSPADFISNISCLRKSGLMLHGEGRTTTFLVNKFEALPGPYQQLTAK